MPLLWGSLSGLDRSVRTGRPALDAVQSRDLWAYLQEHPDEADVFDHAMTGKAVAGVAGVLATYDFSAFTTVVDVGGGRGHLLRAVLDAAPSARGVLFDLAEVIKRLDVGHPRMTTAAGSFFIDALPRRTATS
jgi:C-methyltransferase